MGIDQSTICDAITSMKIVEFRYKGSWRTAEPHALGYNQRGKLTLCAWQLSGGSGADWRDFHVELISEFIVTDDTFQEPRPGFNPCDKTLSTVVCSV